MIIATEISKAIKGMKNKKAGEKNNWKTEWMKEGGSEMVQSLATLFNRVEENKIPIQWRKQKLSQFTKKETKKG